MWGIRTSWYGWELLGTRGCPGEGEGDDVVEVVRSVATLPTKPASMFCSGLRCEGARSGVGGVGKGSSEEVVSLDIARPCWVTELGGGIKWWFFGVWLCRA